MRMPSKTTGSLRKYLAQQANCPSDTCKLQSSASWPQLGLISLIKLGRLRQKESGAYVVENSERKAAQQVPNRPWKLKPIGLGVNRP
jgi:hypothetical protein